MNLLQSILEEFRQQEFAKYIPKTQQAYDFVLDDMEAFLTSSLSRLGRELVESLPTDRPNGTKTDDELFVAYVHGWNSARESVIKALKDNGVDL